jgi:hypothetical protein
MDYDRWSDLYEPRADAEGCLLREHLDGRHDIDNGNVWTLVDAEGEELLIPGYHRVNRIGYVLTDLPHDHGPLEVLWPTAIEPTECPTCGHDNENHNPYCERCDALLPINEDRHV